MFDPEETCHVCGRSEPSRAVITETHHYPVCVYHVGDVMGDIDGYREEIPNY